MGQVIAVANQKGGVAKTTTTINLGAALVEKGARVLVIDLDQQGSLGKAVGLDPAKLPLTIYNVLGSYAGLPGVPTTDGTDEEPMANVLQKTGEGFDVAPANRMLAGLELMLIQVTERETLLKRALAPIRSQYDYILIDCPPSLGLLAINALVAADILVIPLQTQFLAQQGVTDLLQTVTRLRKSLNPTLRIGGVFLTMVAHNGHAATVVADARGNLPAIGVPVYRAFAPHRVSIQDAAAEGISVLRYQPKSDVANAYRGLAQEIINASAPVSRGGERSWCNLADNKRRSFSTFGGLDGVIPGLNDDAPAQEEEQAHAPVAPSRETPAAKQPRTAKQATATSDRPAPTRVKITPPPEPVEDLTGLRQVSVYLLPRHEETWTACEEAYKRVYGLTRSRNTPGKAFRAMLDYIDPAAFEEWLRARGG